ncbi:hypothetical protein V6N13_015082 [Hibiscus sabdariffa]
MLVERKQRRQGKQQVLTNKGTVIPIDGSRFNPIYDDNANVNVQTNQSEIIFDSSPVDVNNLVLVSTPQNHILKVPCGKKNSSRMTDLLNVTCKSSITLRKNPVIPIGLKSSNVVVPCYLSHWPSSSNQSQGNHGLLSTLRSIQLMSFLPRLHLRVLFLFQARLIPKTP